MKVNLIFAGILIACGLYFAAGIAVIKNARRAPIALAIELPTPKGHPCYLDSVVMCGVWSADAAGVPTGHSIAAPAGSQYYVSYKYDGKIYWSQKPVTLQAGELLWTDGKKIIRARCGNELKPVRPTAPTGIKAVVADETLDREIPLPAPEFPAGVIYQSSFTQVGQPPDQPPTVDVVPPVGLPPTFFGCCGAEPTPVVQTPDATRTALLVVTILVLVVAFFKIRIVDGLRKHPTDA